MNLYKDKAIIVAVSLLLGGCNTILSPYRSPDIRSTTQQTLFRDSSGTDTTTLADLPWMQLFPDEKLQALIEQGLANNVNIKNAIEQINIAAASFRQSKDAFYPTLAFSPTVNPAKASAAASGYPPGSLTSTTYQMALSSSWEIDIWGRLASSKRAALASLLGSDAAKRAVQTQVIANIANYYYQLMALDAQVEITKLSIETYKKDTAAMKALLESNVVNGASVVQSEANLHAAEVSLPDILLTIRQTENALAVILGKVPGPIDRNRLDSQKINSDLRTGIPVQLLSNRPDVQQAEFSFRNAWENTNASRASFYPTLSITSATAGLSALKPKDLFSNAIFFNVVGGLAQPIFNQGVNRANLKIAKANQQIALNNFYNTLLVAGQDVSNSLYSYEMGVEKESRRKEQIGSLKKAVDFTNELLRYNNRSTNYTDVLTSEQGLLVAQLSGVNDKLQQLQAIVDLYQALGGGWKR